MSLDTNTEEDHLIPRGTGSKYVGKGYPVGKKHQKNFYFQEDWTGLDWTGLLDTVESKLLRVVLREKKEEPVQNIRNTFLLSPRKSDIPELICSCIFPGDFL